MAKKIKITETALRDAHQSLIATRMTTEEMLPILDQLDKIGHRLGLLGQKPVGAAHQKQNRRKRGAQRRKHAGQFTHGSGLLSLQM